MKVEANNIVVDYITGDIKNIGLKDFVIRKLKRQETHKTFRALDGITFSLSEGDSCGIVGKNGAGKSTLLKVVSGIMVPSSGWINVDGNLAALLELGSGFDPNLTVRENTFLRGALLGYTRKFMNEVYSDIIEFAELEDFQEVPYKTLSSGMRSRLAFSIACLLKPEILILDEVLSVGDGAFRVKSEMKMKEIIGNGAITLFVSHSLAQVRKVCNKALWIEKGKQLAFGDCQEICDMYEAHLAEEAEKAKARAKAKAAKAAKEAREAERKAEQANKAD